MTSQFPVTWHSLISYNIYYLFYLPLFSTFRYLLVCPLFILPACQPSVPSCALSSLVPSHPSLLSIALFLCLLLLVPLFPLLFLLTHPLVPFLLYWFLSIVLQSLFCHYLCAPAVNFCVPLLSPFCCCCCSSHQDRGIGSWRTRRDASVLLEELSALGEKHKLER